MARFETLSEFALQTGMLERVFSAKGGPACTDTVVLLT
jgi:hypothetical protein